MYTQDSLEFIVLWDCNLAPLLHARSPLCWKVHFAIKLIQVHSTLSIFINCVKYKYNCFPARRGYQSSLTMLEIYLFIFQDCKIPCKTMEIQSRMIRQIEYKNGVKIIFDPIVHVTKSRPTMDLMTLFSNIGGCLGLTLGYSILQLVGEMETIIMATMKWIASFNFRHNDLRI